LVQTYDDFEIIIVDNDSSDSTKEICNDFAARDARIRYYRNERNLGAAPNFNRTLELAVGRYFKWSAHDDLIKPTYLERCLEVMEGDSEIVLCHSKTVVDDGAERAPLRELTGLDSLDPDQRFATVILVTHWNHDIFGLFRTAALRETGLHRSYYGSDKVLLAEIALLGRCARVMEPLFINRDHPKRSLRAFNLIERRQFIDPATVEKRVIPNLCLIRDYWAVIGQHVREPAVRQRCYWAIAKWWFVNWHAARVGLDLVCAFAPGIAPILHQLRARHHRAGLGTQHELQDGVGEVRPSMAFAKDED
jgi:glycosyltransferase involved in cell wall biosynthesis